MQAGVLLGRLQQGASLGLPHSRPMPGIGKRRHELRIGDGSQTWRIILRLDDDAVVVLEVFSKKTARTPKRVIDTCQQRIRDYEAATEESDT